MLPGPDAYDAFDDANATLLDLVDDGSTLALSKQFLRDVPTMVRVNGAKVAGATKTSGAPSFAVQSSERSVSLFSSSKPSLHLRSHSNIEKQ